jgi:hypothetical protein
MRSPNTGPTVPGWIREQIDLYERAWPLAALGAALAVSILVDACLGILIWTASSVTYYARP